MTQEQWGMGTFLNNAQLYIMGVEAVDYFSNPIFVNWFANTPEFAIW